MVSEKKANRVYTRVGDKGQTSLVSGTKVSKSDPRLDTYGTVDELNSVVGVLAHELGRDLGNTQHAVIREELSQCLKAIQIELFNIGSRLACESSEILATLPGVEPQRVADLERWMDAASESLTPLRNFVLPGGCGSAAQAHIARTVCRRAERLCVALAHEVEIEPILIQYLNRLSDYFFVLARRLNQLMGVAEPTWMGRQ